ncbi:beta and beta-prime subunits of DNA dependent RNA-polymerase [Hortaea werneckii]|nr:beta and beta-prime subunits of DNA dependent RNA-polymerase [Hortaea werneckii]
MNISAPVSNQLTSVSFTHLTSTDIHALSARRITSSTTLDTLLNPIPGGLYTPELGQFGDNACATCGLKNPQCPGHCGHIEMPVPCYHPTFLDQVLRLVRASCVYCYRLKMGRVAVHRFGAKLRLVECGLVQELRELDEITASSATTKDIAAESGSEDEESGEEGDAEAKGLIDQRERFVKSAIARARKEDRLSTQKTEATTNARRAIISEFMGSITKGKKCNNCKGINHSYRKDRFVKIFRKPLSEKDRYAMIQSGHKAKDPIIELRKKQRAERSRKRKRDEKDEGIVADIVGEEEEEPEEEEGDDVNMDEESEGEVEIAGGDMVADAAGEATKKKTAKDQEEYLNPSRIHAQLTALFEREQPILSAVYGHNRQSNKAAAPLTPDMFFLKDILVPPNRYRPEARTGSNEIAEAQENTLYKNILTACDTLNTIQRELSGKESRDSRYRVRTYGDFEMTWITLQDAVNSLIDSDRNPVQGAAAKRNPEGIKQKLEKKEGMFRKYMMGKRVNFAARTVISPDPNIETNEIGVPPVFAVKLTYPEPVTSWNVEELQEAVRNGPFVWPGAVAIESETGQVINLERKNAEERTALANQLLAPSSTIGAAGTRGTRNKKVHRHLNNGDIVIMNRQPTLHKPSMMCHRARVLPGEKTLRMHYANCNTYNADFDGDEMNLHFPQNELARSEALSIADTDHQYLSSTAGNPLRGLIQDHVSMGVALTSRDTLFERGEYMQLLYSALRPEHGHCAQGRIVTVPPAIFKPKMLWTGKQVVTSVLKNLIQEGYEGLTMSGKSTTDPNLWGLAGAKEEGVVVFRDGYLCQGILDKKQIGPSSGGFVNAVYEVYGHTVAGRLLSVMGRLLTRLENMRAFSCGVEDLIFTREGEEKRRDALQGAETLGTRVAAKYVGLVDGEEKEDEDQVVDPIELRKRMEGVLREEEQQAGLDSLMNSTTAKELSSLVTNSCLPTALVRAFPANQMQAMTSSGAKGSKVNANQISCNLGQQVLEGRRVPVMVSGKTLPCFKPFEPSVRAGGYIVDRFLTGVRPQEYFFHAMAGREGLIDTAVKTSRSGYLQRCLIKGMEGLKVEYDSSVRDADGSVIQFLYGEDGLDVAKSKYLSDFKFAAENLPSLLGGLGVRGDFDKVISHEASEYMKQAEKAYRKSGDLGASDPALALYSPSRYAGSMSESVYAAARKYVDENPDKVIRNKKKGIEGARGVTKTNFNAILDLRYLKSVVEAGEAVGVVAGQSVGEPSTQMTLNTFHLAGHSAKNVTLGIPRLREIVMTAAKNIATPTMTLRLIEEMSTDEAKKFAKGISKLALSEILDKVTVTETVGKGTAYTEAKKYQIRLDFFPSKEYMKEYAITVEDVVSTIEHRLLPRLQAMTRKELKKRGDEKSVKAGDKAKASDAMPEIGKSAGATEQESGRPEGDAEGGDDDSDAEGDDDATRDKAKSNRQQAGYEAYEDEEENLLAARNQREDDVEEPEDEGFGGSNKGSPEPDSSEDEEDAADERKARRSAAKDRENRIKTDRKTNDIVKFAFDDISGDSCTFTLEYDSATAKILMLHLVENAARSSLIQSVPGISGAMLDTAATEEAKGTPILAASGVNLPAMWDYQHIINPHHLYTNSVYDILTHYGVEAARASIVIELQSVFGGHGISVDPRHLTLIADYMTRDGGYQAFSRMGYRGNASPFMKMSFETTVGFLRDAVTEGDWDDLTNPSARIVTGRLGKIGTGGFDVFLPVRNGESGGETREVVEEDGDGDVEMEG